MAEAEQNKKAKHPRHLDSSDDDSFSASASHSSSVDDKKEGSNIEGEDSSTAEKKLVFVQGHTKQEKEETPVVAYRSRRNVLGAKGAISRGILPSIKKAHKPTATNGNVLTNLIPGYTAPLKLQSSGLPISDIATMRANAAQNDISTAHAGIQSVSQRDRASRMLQNRLLTSDSSCKRLGSYTRKPKAAPDTTAGEGWFNMQPAEMTDELKTDLKVLQMRGYLDPKRFYKSADKPLHKGNKRVVQLGTVVEGMGEFNSSRLTKKQRRQNLTEEIMAETSIRAYARKASNQITVAKEQRYYPTRRSSRGKGKRR